MNAHIVGKGRFSGGEGPSAPSFGTSLAVAQFVELVRGERPVQEPSNPFRVEQVRTETRYCMNCCCLRHFDVVYIAGGQQIRQCRCCGGNGGT